MQLFSKSHVAIFSLKQNKTSKKSKCYFTTGTYLGVTFTKEYSNYCL